LDILTYLDISELERRAPLIKNKISSIRLAPKNAMEPEYRRNYERLKRENRKEKA
jgi:hypothetical protein